MYIRTQRALAVGVSEEDSEKSVEIANIIKNVVTEEQNTVDATKESFVTLNKNINHSMDGIHSVSEKKDKLISGKDTVMASVENLSAISEENAASTEEVNASVEEMRASFIELNDKSENLNGVSKELSKSMEIWKICEP